MLKIEPILATSLVVILTGCSSPTGSGETPSPLPESPVLSGENQPETSADESDVVSDSENDNTSANSASERDLSSLQLHGTIPAVALAAPEFGATSHDGTHRTKANLIGKPTIMWFFPLAGTPG